MSIPLWPSGVTPWRAGSGRVSILLHRRSLLVTGVLLALLLPLALWSLTVGESEIGLAEVLGSFTGTTDPGLAGVVLDWRLPRVLMALVAGACLALSGAVFQSVTRNPLGSPDIIGFNAGAYTGALLAMGVFGGGYVAAGAGALIGGTLTGVVIYLLAWRGGVQGYRLIVVGIGVSAMLTAFNSYLQLSGSLEQAVTGSVWGAGSLNLVRWSDVVPVVVTLLIAIPFLFLAGQGIRALELGDERARAGGLRVEPVRLALLLLGVALTAVVTAMAGPLAFVALIAPQVALRLAGTPGIPFGGSAAVGAAMLLLGDMIARTVIAPAQLPVGVVTVSLGGFYLLGMLALRARKGTAR